MASRLPAGLAVCVGVLLLVAAPLGEAVYTKVKEGQQKCFIELLHANHVVVLKYESPDQAPLPQEPEAQKGHVGILFQVHSHVKLCLRLSLPRWLARCEQPFAHQLRTFKAFDACDGSPFLWACCPRMLRIKFAEHRCSLLIL